MVKTGPGQALSINGNDRPIALVSSYVIAEVCRGWGDSSGAVVVPGMATHPSQRRHGQLCVTRLAFATPYHTGFPSLSRVIDELSLWISPSRLNAMRRAWA